METEVASMKWNVSNCLFQCSVVLVGVLCGRGTERIFVLVKCTARHRTIVTELQRFNRRLIQEIPNNMQWAFLILLRFSKKKKNEDEGGICYSIFDTDAIRILTYNPYNTRFFCWIGWIRFLVQLVSIKTILKFKICTRE